METEAEKFFNALPSEQQEKPFDILKALDAERSGTEAAEDKTDEKSESKPEGEAEDDSVPFAKNPKIMRFIERQVRKAVGEQPKAEEKPKAEEPKASQEEIPAEWLMAYGDNDQSRSAWNLQQKLMSEAVRRAKDEAKAEIREAQEAEKAEERKFERFIAESLESIEDSSGVDLTSGSPSAKKARTEFLEMVTKLSPKDGEGNVTGYADFSSVWEMYQASRQKEPASETTAQKKQIASRMMAKSGEAKAVTPNLPRKSITFDSISFN